MFAFGKYFSNFEYPPNSTQVYPVPVASVNLNKIYQEQKDLLYQLEIFIITNETFEQPQNTKNDMMPPMFESVRMNLTES